VQGEAGEEVDEADVDVGRGEAPEDELGGLVDDHVDRGRAVAARLHPR
jgi:hypothetical protein